MNVALLTEEQMIALGTQLGETLLDRHTYRGCARGDQ
jgi:hypothetical protein